VFVRELQQKISTLRGVGRSVAESYLNLGILTYGDLLLLVPRTYEDRSTLTPLGNLPDGNYANTIVEVIAHSYFGHGKKRTLKVTIKDISGEGDGKASLLCFNRNFLERILRIGSHFYLYGLFQRNFNELQSSQFEMMPLANDGSLVGDFGKFLPVYPLSGSLSQRIVRRDINNILSQYTEFSDELPADIMQSHNLLQMDRAIRLLHGPANNQEIQLALRSLAFTEIFYLLLVSRRKTSLNNGNLQQNSMVLKEVLKLSRLEEHFVASLPFSLTTDQITVLEEIRLDLASPAPMNRLLQGDVGSGKTLVAWISALRAIQNKGQVAFMAPTELLARQHAQLAAELLEPLGIRIAFLTGSVGGKERKLLLKALATGEIDIIIGTHALFSQEVVFYSLSFIIIDEQHRFGVIQRLSLLEKGRAPDVLMMTATPIPRTLALTVFSDLAISTIRTMPTGRLPITTYLVADESRKRMYAAIGVEFSRKHQAYFVYPRIDSTGNSDLRDVETMFQYLSSEVYPGIPSALIHSRLPEEEKVAILNRFRLGELAYLVSTSVVEVGIDVPNATCMVIEHAERFGLSALHQLRGRVGRSTLQSYCFLVYEQPLSEDAKQRIMVMKESNDGFHIAEQDLAIRGPGEVAGTRQSGFLRLRFASLTNDLPLINEVKSEVDNLLLTDPGLLKSQNAVIRNVLLKAPPFEERVTEG
jgi:ATP-dependent DNA helicase RecG